MGVLSNILFEKVKHNHQKRSEISKLYIKIKEIENNFDDFQPYLTSIRKFQKRIKKYPKYNKLWDIFEDISNLQEYIYEHYDSYNDEVDSFFCYEKRMILGQLSNEINNERNHSKRMKLEELYDEISNENIYDDILSINKKLHTYISNNKKNSELLKFKSVFDVYNDFSDDEKKEHLDEFCDHILYESEEYIYFIYREMHMNFRKLKDKMKEKYSESILDEVKYLKETNPDFYQLIEELLINRNWLDKEEAIINYDWIKINWEIKKLRRKVFWKKIY